MTTADHAGRQRLPAFLARRGIHYGWVVAATTFATMLVTAGTVGAPGVLILPLQREFGWETADISGALAVRLLLFGLMGPFAAGLMNRIGVRRTTLLALSLVGSGLFASLWMREVWQLFLLWGVVVGLGTGLTALVLAATVATRWFSARRGLVVGLLTASTATGQLIFLPLLSHMAGNGWRPVIVLIVVLLACAGALVLMFMRNDPAEVGQRPYGAPADAPPVAIAGPAASPLRAPLEALAAASRTRTFWLLFATFFICGASTNGLIQTHFIPMCADFGLRPTGAATVLAMMGVFDFIGTVASGWLSDRYSNRWLLFWYYGLRGLSLLWLPYSEFTLYGLSLFAVFYGLDWIATVPPTVKITAERFGPQRANLVFGWVFAGHQLGAAAAAYGAGLARTELASYLPAFFVAGVLCLAAAPLALLLGGGGGARRAAHRIAAPQGATT